MTEPEVAWLAGLFEGEACFDENNRSRDKGYVRIRIQMVDADVILRAHSLLGVGTLRTIPGKKPHHSTTTMLSISRTDDAVRILRLLRPWMGQRRGAKIDELLARREDRQARQTR